MFAKKRIFLVALMAAICIIAPVLCMCSVGKGEEENTMRVLTLWQIDGFEGGKGSRAQYLQDKADECFDGSPVYVRVTSLSAEAARKNMSAGTLPDIISYAAGFYGLEQYINPSFQSVSWCRGGYCLLALGDNADFSDVNAHNTVINEGKDNLSALAAMFEGLNGAEKLNSTSAYLKLIGGKYKYLLGTQRDIYRLQTRGETFSVKAITSFNDLYQNISVLCNGEDYDSAVKFVNYLLSHNDDLDKIGMISSSTNYTGAMQIVASADYQYILNTFVGEDYIKRLKDAANGCDINLAKSLLK